MSESEALYGSEPRYVIEEKSAVFKQDLKEASEEAEQRSSSREFQTNETGLVKRVI